MANCFRRKTDQSGVPEKTCDLLHLHEKKCSSEELIVQDTGDAFFGKTDIAAEQAETLESAAIRQIPERTLESAWRPLLCDCHSASERARFTLLLHTGGKLMRFEPLAIKARFGELPA